jgi:hypothetical protein
MNKIVEIVMDRDGNTEEDARALIEETRDEIMCNPESVDEIIQDYLGLEPDYLDYILHY